MKRLLLLLCCFPLLSGCEEWFVSSEPNPIEFKLNGVPYCGVPTDFFLGSKQGTDDKEIKTKNRFFRIVLQCKVESEADRFNLYFLLQLNDYFQTGRRYELFPGIKWYNDKIIVGESGGRRYDFNDLVSGWVEFSKIKHIAKTDEYVVSGTFELLFKDEDGNPVNFTEGRLKSYKLPTAG